MDTNAFGARIFFVGGRRQEAPAVDGRQEAGGGRDALAYTVGIASVPWAPVVPLPRSCVHSGHSIRPVGTCGAHGYGNSAPLGRQR